MQRFQIERVSLENIELIVPLFDEYRVFYGQQSDTGAARDFLLERLNLNESIIFTAVEGDLEDKRAVGFTQLYPSFSSVSMQRLWILNDLFVTTSSRGCGVGSLLLDAAREWAVTTGAKGLSLTTMTGNTGAQRLYEASGYVRDCDFYSYNLYF
ncbi:GNAT family N-acetyltransferase [Paenibacillus wynnii]|uniref:GNAT family N-acetyltransferase n=1 Tax=Paenibacillus wynnii TaxID=268407 RepID=UPI0027939B6E|nr:GNAT family N-acetyltransferase [Paenibacillus wynnii]MDQ0196498.1 GNAT superfamily N-acetyltransferase [Paenibacillus wynnii]